MVKCIINSATISRKYVIKWERETIRTLIPVNNVKTERDIDITTCKVYKRGRSSSQKKLIGEASIRRHFHDEDSAAVARRISLTKALNKTLLNKISRTHIWRNVIDNGLI